jgi:hypothetical protein
MPVTVLQQDWGAALGFDAAARWRAWAPDLHHATVSWGHFMAEEAPGGVAAALCGLLARRPRHGPRPASRLTLQQEPTSSDGVIASVVFGS